MSDVSDQLAAKIRRLRQTRGLNRDQLAEQCAKHGAPDMTAAVLTNIETGRKKDENGRRQRHITVDELTIFARVFGTTPAVLLDQTCPLCNSAPPTGFTCNACGESGK